MPAADSGYAFVVLLRDGDDATGLARLLEDVRLPEAATPSVFAAPPVRGVDFFGDEASQSTLDQWWADNIPGDALPAYLLNHEDGLAGWVNGLDGTFYIGLPNPALADEYPKASNIRTFLSGGPLDFATIIMRDFSGGGEDGDDGSRGIIFDQGEALRMAALSSDFPIDLDDTAFDFGEPEPPPAGAPGYANSGAYGAPAASPFGAAPASPFATPPPATSPFASPPPAASPFGAPQAPAASPFDSPLPTPAPAFSPPPAASPFDPRPAAPTPFPGGAPQSPPGFAAPAQPAAAGAPGASPFDAFSGGFAAPPFGAQPGGPPPGAAPVAKKPDSAGPHPFDLLTGGSGSVTTPNPVPQVPPPAAPSAPSPSPWPGAGDGGGGGGTPSWQGAPSQPANDSGGFRPPQATPGNGGAPRGSGGGGGGSSRPKVPKFSMPGFSVLGKRGSRNGFVETPNRELANMIVDRGPTIVVMGSRKGGVGKTSYAAGIAIVAGTVLDAVGHKAAIVDANIANPDAWGQMNLREGAATVREVVAALTANREPPPAVHSTTPALAVYPESRETTEYSKTDVKRFADYLRRRYTFIVVDMSNRLPDPMAGPEAAAAAYWIEHADVLVLPTTSSKNDFNGVLDYLDVRALPPTVVPYIIPSVKKNREHPVTQQYLSVIKDRVHRIVEIPDEADKVRYAGMEGVPVEQVSPTLRAAYRELTEVIIRVPPRARI